MSETPATNPAPAPAATPPAATPPAATPPAGTPPAGTGTPPAGTGTPPAGTGTPPAEGSKAFYESLAPTWREDLAKGLNLAEPEVKMLGRVPDFKTFATNYFEAQRHIAKRNSADLPQLPDNPTPEQLIEYRTKAQLPVSLDDYKLVHPEGVEWDDEADGAVMNAIREVAFNMNIKPAHAQAVVDVVLAKREEQIEMVEQQHGIDRQQATQLLKQNYGSDYNTNINIVAGLVSRLPEAIRAEFEGAQLANGRKLFNSPEVIHWLVDMGRELNPSATVVPSTSNPGQTMDDEIEKIEGLFNTDKKKYYAPETQKRYDQLLEAREKMKAQQRKTA